MKFKTRILVAITLILPMLPLAPVSMQTVPAGSQVGERVKEPAPIFGHLKTDLNKPIELNGVNVVSGTSISSGAQLVTPDLVGAQIMLKSRASIRMAPKAKLRLDFSGESVLINLLEGCVTLNTYDGFAGAISTPNGKIAKAGPVGRDFVEVCSRNNGEVVSVCRTCPAATIPLPGGAISPLVYLLGGGGGAAGILFATNQDGDGRSSPLSTFTPGQP